MKIFIASDIHGSAFWCEKMLSAYEESKAERMLLLGDLLYHGPRNDLPLDYAPKKVIEMLSKYKNDIICVRGNCDTEVDQMVLPFPILADYSVLSDDYVTVYATHGHKFGKDNPPPLRKGDILLCGHTHIAADEAFDEFRYINPGSVSIPKENTGNGYIIYEKGIFVRKLLK